jgi:hypothetical protein
MKPKKIEKRLSLNKKTVVNLQNLEMEEAKGGRAPTIIITPITIGYPFTCLCSYNTQPQTCCCP